MDEPTSSLTHVETQTLHEMIRALREAGKTIVYVSHFLDEVLELSDTVTVLRNGRLVRTAPAAQETESSLVTGMFGAAVEAEHFEKPEHSTAPVMFEVDGLSREGVLNEVSFTIRAGEIVGLAGLVGSGRTELARAVAGADPVDRGTIRVDGKECRIRTPADAIAAGIAFLPESRKEEGLFMQLTLAANTTFVDMRSVSARGFLRPVAERTKARDPAAGAVGPSVDGLRSGREPVGREPAEGAVRALAVQAAARADPRRADAGRRRRGEGCDPPAHQRPRRAGRGDPDDLVRARGGARAGPSRPRHPPGCDRRTSSPPIRRSGT